MCLMDYKYPAGDIPPLKSGSAGARKRNSFLVRPFSATCRVRTSKSDLMLKENVYNREGHGEELMMKSMDKT